MKEGWKVVKLGDVCEFYRGLTYSKKDEVGQSNNIVLRSNNIDLRTFKLNLDDLKYISDDIIIPTEKKVKKGSLLICIANGSKEHLGKIALIDEDIDFAFGGFMGLLTPTLDVMPMFLYLMMISDDYKSYIKSLSDGANINNLKYKELAQYKIPLPPLPEQHRIVKKLDAAFEKIDAMKAKAEKNIENAKALFQQTLAEELEPKEGWVEKKLGEIGIGKMSYGSATSSKEYDGSTRYVRITDIDDDGNLQYEKKSPLFYAEKYILEEGDLLFARTGATVGKTYLYKSADGRCLYAGYLIRLKVNTRIMNPNYLFYCTKTNRYKDFIRISQKAAAQPNINAEIYSNYLVSFPQDKEIQQQIVTKLDNLSAKCKKLEEAERKTIAECDALKQAILRQAFNGEL